MSTSKATKTTRAARRAVGGTGPTGKPAAKRRTTQAKAPAAAPEIAAPTKAKHKLVRDSFTIPKSEYLVLEGLKMRAASLARPVKKSELLRAGIAVLNGMTDRAFLTAIGKVPSLKTGRPKGVTEPASSS